MKDKMGTWNYLIIDKLQIKICTKSDLLDVDTDGDLFKLISEDNYVDFENKDKRIELIHAKCINNQEKINKLADLHHDKVLQSWLDFHNVDYRVVSEYNEAELKGTENYLTIDDEHDEFGDQPLHDAKPSNEIHTQVRFKAYQENLKQLISLKNGINKQIEMAEKKLNKCFAVGDTVWVYFNDNSNARDSGVVVAKKDKYVSVKLDNQEKEIINTTWNKLVWKKD